MGENLREAGHNLLDHGVPIDVVALRLGHKDALLPQTLSAGRGTTIDSVVLRGEHSGLPWVLGLLVVRLAHSEGPTNLIMLGFIHLDNMTSDLALLKAADDQVMVMTYHATVPMGQKSAHSNSN